MSDFQELHEEMLTRARLGDHAGTVAAAEVYLDRVEESQEPESRDLRAGVYATWLSSKAHLDAAEALPLCDEVFIRFATDSGLVSVAVAASALRIKTELLLLDDDVPGALLAAGKLAEFFDGDRIPADSVQPAEQVIATARGLIRTRQNRPAVGLLRRVVNHLTQAAKESAASELSALAELWLLLALILEGDPGPVPREVEIFDAMGDRAMRAVDRVLRELNGQPPWRQAIVILVSIKVHLLDAQGRGAQAREVREGFIEAFRGKWTDLPSVAFLVEQYKAELNDA